jgi:soluble lytic murein transglycosylase-like protein
VTSLLFALGLLLGGAASHADKAIDLWSARLQQTCVAVTAAEVVQQRAAPPKPPIGPEIGARVARRITVLAGVAARRLSQVWTAMLETPRPPRAPLYARQGFSSVITEASNRFDLPDPWVSAVMQVESSGQADAISPKGAKGLMQIMPATYVYLSARYGLGSDPSVPRDNVLAGSAYLRELYDRYGASGFLAAYNAGPGRYENSLCRGGSLPKETQRYVASVRLAIGEALFGRPGSRFYQPIAIARDGAVLLAHTGKPMPTVERLALHSLIEQASRQAGTK